MNTQTEPAPIHPEVALQAALEAWRCLAGTEAEAIRDRDWSLVAECECELRKLQDYILRAAEAAQHEWTRAGKERGVREASLGTLVSQLLEVQNRNQELLEQNHRESEVQLEQLERKCRDIQRRPRFGFPAQPANQPACAA